jgi:hypothetical protein
VKRWKKIFYANTKLARVVILISDKRVYIKTAKRESFYIMIKGLIQ